MLWNFLQIWMMPNLSHPLAWEWPNRQCVMSVCPQQLAGVWGLSMLRQADGGVRHSFYAILFTVRKKSCGQIPLNLIARSAGCISFVATCKSFSTFPSRLLFCSELRSQCLCWLSRRHPVLAFLMLLFLCLHSIRFCCLSFTFTSSQSLLLLSSKGYLFNCIT